jgi:hypothetical protein
MRNMFLAVVTVATLACVGCTESQHGGGPSQQGGYLGLNAGAHQAPAPAPSDSMSDPLAWCVHSTEPSRCRARAGLDYPICIKVPEHYNACRAAMDQMHPT